VKLLIEAKADINLTRHSSKYHSTSKPLSWAAENGHEDIVKLLRTTKAEQRRESVRQRLLFFKSK
jgi:ankyrin repeat protein